MWVGGGVGIPLVELRNTKVSTSCFLEDIDRSQKMTEKRLGCSQSFPAHVFFILMISHVGNYPAWRFSALANLQMVFFQICFQLFQGVGIGMSRGGGDSLN